MIFWIAAWLDFNAFVFAALYYHPQRTKRSADVIDLSERRRARR